MRGSAAGIAWRHVRVRRSGRVSGLAEAASTAIAATLCAATRPRNGKRLGWLMGARGTWRARWKGGRVAPLRLAPMVALLLPLRMVTHVGAHFLLQRLRYATCD